VLARRRARSGERDDEGHDDPEVGGLLEVPTVKFMPSTPAMSAPGSRSIEPIRKTLGEVDREHDEREDEDDRAGDEEDDAAEDGDGGGRSPAGRDLLLLGA
jgi:hypothetical protein